MGAEERPRTSIEELLAEVRSQIERPSPVEAEEAAADGDLLIDIRPVEQRRRDGLVPGATIVERNVLEWRLDPGGEHRNPDLARPDHRIILICDEGYQSSLAAATLRRFGLDACDVIDGVQGWMAAGLPLEDIAFT
ncbi:MAG TPA: rhodanese-like domain-containing protein [Solirubrobacterales bacterium]|nr:rhodanese-like domain-containing protein [Solirubrobacterales bacterium]